VPLRRGTPCRRLPAAGRSQPPPGRRRDRSRPGIGVPCLALSIPACEHMPQRDPGPAADEQHHERDIHPEPAHHLPLPSLHGGPCGNGCANAALIHDRGVIKRHALATARLPTQVSTCRYGHVSRQLTQAESTHINYSGTAPADRAHRLSQAPVRRLRVRVAAATRPRTVIGISADVQTRERPRRRIMRHSRKASPHSRPLPAGDSMIPTYLIAA
jgi:hypothetical protein